VAADNQKLSKCVQEELTPSVEALEICAPTTPIAVYPLLATLIVV
jgi:hypothetical protein